MMADKEKKYDVETGEELMRDVRPLTISYAGLVSEG